MQTFSNQRSYNDHVDNVIAGPLTPREILALIRAGARFTDRTLETEWSLALLRGLGRAPDPEPFSKAFYRGRATALAGGPGTIRRRVSAGARGGLGGVG